MRLTTRSTGRSIASRRPILSIRHPTTLNLDPNEIEATLRPVERATMLPPRAFVDPGVLDWELETIFRGWICVGHASRVAEPGSYMMREIGPDSVVVMGGTDGGTHAFL